MFPLKNGDDAPEIALTSVQDEEWRLSDHRGKMVIIHCCRGEY